MTLLYIMKSCLYLVRWDFGHISLNNPLDIAEEKFCTCDLPDDAVLQELSSVGDRKRDLVKIVR